MIVRPIDIDAEIEQLLTMVIDQNFVPVVDGREAFIGIVRRRTILSFFREKMLTTLRHQGSDDEPWAITDPAASRG